MNAEELRILFVEDSPQDVELEERQLRKGGVVFHSLRVETRETLIRALTEFKPDLVISDYTLPRLDGLSALRIVREHSPQSPFIFVSGTIGEERAVASLKEGATDYVLKGSMQGFVRAVERALREARNRAERRELEAQLRQSQKMEAVGRLANGVAHDFNNLLTVITGYTRLVLERIGNDDPSRADLREVLQAVDRAGDLTRQLLTLSRKQVVDVRSIDLNAVVVDMIGWFRRLIDSRIELVVLLDWKLGRTKADPRQIEQILLNLALNARDAMPRGGVLTVQTSNVEAGPGSAEPPPGIPAGPYVLLSVGDNGCGMSDEVRSHLFEPFFTTKDPGKGTGLGLSIVYGIVKQSGGGISVDSEVDRGTTFRVYLPRSEEPGRPPEVLPLAAVPSSRGGETILVAEDEEAVRRLMRSVLEEAGYVVIEAADGASAARQCSAWEGPVHLLLTDLVLPGMSGRELAEAARASRPDLQVLYTSGYLEEAGVHRAIAHLGIPFLPKPFTPEALVRRVREVLSGGT